MAKNKLQGITLEIGGDTTELSKALKQPNKEAGELQSKLNAVDQALKLDPSNTEILEQKFRILGQVIEKNEDKLHLLKTAQKQFIDTGKDIDSAEYIELQRQIALTTSKINKLKNSQEDVSSSLKGIGSGSAGIRKVNNEAKNLDDSLDDVKSSSGGVKDALVGAFIGGGIAEAVSSIADSLGAVIDESMEYIKIMSSLETSSQLAGYSAEETSQTYKQLYEVLGDDQTAATTTANLQALGLSQEKLTALTNGTIGAWAKYGDSIPIDGLAEAINETAKVGQVTGTFADVLNWAGTSEDDFNAKLAKTKTESERANLILQELTDQGLISAADAWKENAGSLTDMNRAQAEWQEATAGLSQQIMPVFAQIKSGFAGLLSSVSGLLSGDMSFDEFGNQIASGMQNALSSVTKFIPEFISKGADILLSMSEGMIQGIPDFLTNLLATLQQFGDYLTEQAPVWIDKGFEMLSNFVQGIIDSLPVMIEQLPQVLTTFANIINDNFPMILAKGAELLWQFITGIISAVPTLIANIPQIVEAIVSVISAFNWLNLGSSIMNFFKDGILGMGGFIKEAGKSIYNSFVQFLQNLPANLKNLGTTAIKNLGSAVKGAVQYVKDAASTIVTNIVSGLKSLPDKMLNIGKDIVRGIWNGISNMGGWLLKKIGGWAGDIIDGFCGLFGINSPSTVMRDRVGKYLPAGIGVGIEENSDLALKPLAQLQREMTSSFTPDVNATVSRTLSMESQAVIEIHNTVPLDGKPIYQNVERMMTKVQRSKLAFKGV